MENQENMKEIADVVIVGAGPGGAMAGYALVQAGADVVLLDRATFPRDKSCGDGLGYDALMLLKQMGLRPWIEAEEFSRNRQFLLSSPDGTSAVAPGPEAKQSYAIPRTELDAQLVEAVAGAGVRLHVGTHVTGLERLAPDRVRLSATRDGATVHYEAPLVIAADGGHATFTRSLGLAPHPAEMVAVRAYYEGDLGPADQFEIHWDAAVLPAYCWIFPSGAGRANVGVGAYTRDVKAGRLNLRAELETFIAHNPHAQARLGSARRISRVVGHPLRADAPDVTPYADNVLVAGEAAGVVNPLSGEGIGPSMVCGEMAADHALRALERGAFSAEALADYGRDFHARFDAGHRAARLVRRLVQYPWAINRVMHRASRDVTYATQIYRILCGELSMTVFFTPQMMIKTLLG